MIKQILATTIFVVSILTLSLSGTTTQTHRSSLDVELPGSALKWIHIAEREFDKQKLNIDKYRVIVDEDEDTVAVIFLGLKVPKNVLGSVGPDPGFEVEIRKKDVKVLRANYVR